MKYSCHRRIGSTSSSVSILSLTGIALASIAIGQVCGWAGHRTTTTKRSTHRPNDDLSAPYDPVTARSSIPHLFITKERHQLRLELAKNRDAFWEEDSSRGETDEDYYSTPKATTATSDLDDEMFQLKWEACPTDAGTAHVLLPPPTQRLPTCIIHFVGGTFFGSTPHVWYHQLLEDLVRHSSAAIVATSIPVTVLQSPLQHVELAKKLRQQFQAAYRQVLVDEYEGGTDDDRGLLRDVPLCGLGHSLGARLLVVAATLPPTSRSRSGVHRTSFSYKSLILMSFTNFGASAGIPGVGSLYRASRKVEQRQDRDSSRPGRRRSGSRKGMDDDRDLYDDDDEDFDEAGLWKELTDVVRESARWIQSSLTPDSSQLEFYPTPAQLWAAVSPTDASGGGGGRYRTPQTLLIQFDQDRVDQSARFAAAVRECSDVKFCRLRGNHLTPLSPNPQSEVVGWSRRMMDPHVMGDLRRSVVRFLTEVVTKD